MKITYIIKRDGRSVEFDQKRIEIAVQKAMKAANEKIDGIPQKVAKSVVTVLEKEKQKNPEFIPSVEGVQDIVERELMRHKCYETARTYIRYRDWRARLRKRNIFEKRVNLKPYEYPELIDYVDAMRHSYWIHTEFNFTSDIQDFKSRVDAVERNAIKNATMAIAQIEVAVKVFWGDIYKRFPKPEIGAIGYTFAESEVRHMDAYAHLLKILGLENEFEKIKDIPALNNRVLYLERAKKDVLNENDREFTKSLLLFSIFIEHVSLFSQFLVIMSFNKYKNLFKGVSNAVEATSKEEQIHGLFGIELINLIKTENPDWFDKNYENSIIEFCNEAYKTEEELIDWIFEKGELKFLPAKTVKNFVRYRLNNDLAAVGLPQPFLVNENLTKETEWFDDEVIGTKQTDFFFKRSINYSKRQISITEEDIF
jgi:ribonucleoside-diphosphate reductase beta chain